MGGKGWDVKEEEEDGGEGRGGWLEGNAARRLLIPNSFKQPRLIRRTPLIFGLFTSLLDKSLATTMATHTVYDVKCMARSTHHKKKMDKIKRGREG